METAGLFLVIAFAGGYAARFVGLPPMLGFLVAGFGLAASGQAAPEALHVLANLGVTLFVFAVGLKLDIGQLLRREVWLTAVVHTTLMVGIGTAVVLVPVAVGVAGFAGLSLSTAALIAFALSFSSTVFVVKLLEERSELRSRYGQIAIGILVMQDLVAVGFVALTNGRAPSVWALGLVLLIPGRRLLGMLLERIGHEELLIVFGVMVALVPGYLLFDAVGLKGDLGAILMGILLAPHRNSGDLAKALFSIKELLLVAFFLSIGLEGLPSWGEVAVALALLVLLPLQSIAYVALISMLGMRRRTAVLSALVLSNNSEFGLIVASTAVGVGLLEPTWLTIISVAVAMSFLVASLANLRAEPIADFVETRWPDPDPQRLDAHERPIPLHDVDVLVLGMGRIGQAAYDRLSAGGLRVMGVEHDGRRVEKLGSSGREVIEGDATDTGLWKRLQAVRTLDTVVLAMPFHHANVDCLRVVRKRQFAGTVVAVARYDDEVSELMEHGATSVLHLYVGSGMALADAALAARSEVPGEPTA
ncbi:MAG: cation:proton antiporter family protein [Nocardioides sp.]